MRKGDLEEALSVLNLVPVDLALNFVFLQKARIYAMRDMKDSIPKLISQVESGNYASLNDIYLILSETYALAGDRL